MTWLLPALIIVIMVFSGLGYFAGDNAGSADDYNGFSFTQRTNDWVIDDLNVAVPFHPVELEYIDCPEINLSDEVYLTFDPDIPGLDYVDLIRLDLSEFLSEKIVYAGVSTPANISLPVIQCGAVNGTVINLAVGNESVIKKDNDCYTLQGSSTYDLVRVSERFKFTMAGIMNASS